VLRTVADDVQVLSGRAAGWHHLAPNAEQLAVQTCFQRDESHVDQDQGHDHSLHPMVLQELGHGMLQASPVFLGAMRVSRCHLTTSATQASTVEQATAAKMPLASYFIAGHTPEVTPGPD